MYAIIYIIIYPPVTKRGKGKSGIPIATFDSRRRPVARARRHFQKGRCLRRSLRPSALK